jgi:hypothetical protein
MTYCPSSINPIASSTQINYQYNYNYGSAYCGGPDDPQHKQLHRIWETDSDGELLINRDGNGSSAAPAASATDPSTTTRHMFLDIYLPNGLLLPIQCPTQRTLSLLKQDIFIQARK